MTTALVVVGGSRPVIDPSVLPKSFLVVAADSGLDNAAVLGLTVDVVVGDMDSVSADALARAREQGAEVIGHPSAKDATDFELAMHEAMDRSAERIVVLAATGGRLDHFLANVGVIASDAFASCQVEMITDDEYVWVIRERTQLTSSAGSTITLLPIGGDATGVTTDGMRWELTEAVLPAGTSRGVSNVAETDNPSVAVASGVLLAIDVGRIGD